MFLSNFFPQDCLLCAARAEAVLCDRCTLTLPHSSALSCPQCAAEGSSNICGNCLREPPHFDSTTAAFRYAFPLDKLIQSFKFNANFALVKLLADALGERVKIIAMPPTMLLPMPLGAKRLKERGFNQAALLAQAMSKQSGIAVEMSGLLRVRETPPQMGLKWNERSANVKGAFDCHANLSGQHIALIDDVMTTGATLNEAAKILKRQGAARVDAWVVARVAARNATAQFDE